MKLRSDCSPPKSHDFGHRSLERNIINRSTATTGRFVVTTTATATKIARFLAARAGIAASRSRSTSAATRTTAATTFA